jgi:hypothetical protein
MKVCTSCIKAGKVSKPRETFKYQAPEIGTTLVPILFFTRSECYLQLPGIPGQTSRRDRCLGPESDRKNLP